MIKSLLKICPFYVSEKPADGRDSDKRVEGSRFKTFLMAHK